MFSERQVGVDAEIMLVDVGRSDGGEIADGYGVAVHRHRSGVVLRRDRKLLQDVDDRAVKRQRLKRLEASRRRERDLRTRSGQTFVLKFVSAKDEPLVVHDGAACGNAGAVVIEAVLQAGVFLLVVKGVVVAVAVVTPSRSVPVVGAGLGDGIEDPAGRVPVFGAELVGEQGELGDRFLNDRLRGAVGIELVVFHAVDVEPVKAGARSADRTSRPEHTALLRGGTRRKDRELLYVSAEGVQRQVVHYLAAESRPQFRGLRIDQFGPGFHFHHRGDRTQLQLDLGIGGLVGGNRDSLLYLFLKTVLFHGDGTGSHQQVREYVGSGA